MPALFRLSPGGGAIYQQIVEQFKRLILVGALEPGAQLPTTKQLATDLTVNPNTVVRAYRDLEHDGMIFSVPGRGTFVRNDFQAGERRTTAIAETTASFARLIRDARALGLSESEMGRSFNRALGLVNGAASGGVKRS